MGKRGDVRFTAASTPTLCYSCTNPDSIGGTSSVRPPTRIAPKELRFFMNFTSRVKIYHNSTSFDIGDYSRIKAREVMVLWGELSAGGPDIIGVAAPQFSTRLALKLHIRSANNTLPVRTKTTLANSLTVCILHNRLYRLSDAGNEVGKRPITNRSGKSRFKERKELP